MIVSKNVLSGRSLPLPENALIVDIETTGFSPKFARIYMIGFLRVVDGQIEACQWLAEKDGDEYEMLYRFNTLLSDGLVLYHYNGEQFDMPFIKGRMQLYDMDCHPYESRDMLKMARPFKALMGLDNLKLKSIEAWFGYEREDPFSGGDLIDVYKAFQASGDVRLAQTLLLHNYEDLAGLVDVMVHLPLFDLLNALKAGTFPIHLHYSTMDEGYYEGRFEVSLPGHYVLNPSKGALTLNPKEGIFRMPVKSGWFYHFFSDYKNYHYLIQEGYAVHKSIGQFVAKEHRMPATRATAYVKKQGFFLPAGKRYELDVPLYYENATRQLPFVSVDNLFDAEAFEPYILAVLKEL